MSFIRKDYEFLRDIGIGPRNPGCYVNGSWKAHGPIVSTLNPANNQVPSSSWTIFGMDVSWIELLIELHFRSLCRLRWSCCCMMSLVSLSDRWNLTTLEFRPLVDGWPLCCLVGSLRYRVFGGSEMNEKALWKWNCLEWQNRIRGCRL